MPEQPQPTPSAGPDVEASLHAVSQLLREAPHLSADARQTLADLVDELGHAIGSGKASPEELAHLQQSTARLLEAVRQRHDEGRVAAARDRLEEAVIGLEARAPVVTGVARRLLDALANFGI
jgi:hypothetical protein